MRRLCRKRQKKCLLFKADKPSKDKEGNRLDIWKAAIEINAEIWPATDKLQAELYGSRIVNICNMLYQGNIGISKGDGISLVSLETPEYRVISGGIPSSDGIYKYEIERQ